MGHDVRSVSILSAALLGVFACSDDTQVTGAADAPVVGAPAGGSASPPAPPRVLLYGKETEWFHASTPIALQVMGDRGKARGWTVTTAKDSAVFTPAGLAAFDVIVFLNSSGQTLDGAQRGAFASYIATGHGWVGAHAASHTDYDWSFMNDLVGANFCCHVLIMPANVLVQPAAMTDPIITHLPTTWARSDEWYTFDHPPEQNPRLKVLLALDENSARPDYPGPDLSPALRVGFHAIAWKQQFGATRSFYTGMGHTVESWQDELFVTMMLKAVEWAAGHGQ